MLFDLVGHLLSHMSRIAESLDCVVARDSGLQRA